MVRLRVDRARRDADSTLPSVEVEFWNANGDGVAAGKGGTTLACWACQPFSCVLPDQRISLSFLHDGMNRRQLLRVVG